MQTQIQHYLTIWELQVIAPEWTQVTHSSTLLKVLDTEHKTCVLKCLNKVGQHDEADGARLLEWYSGSGAVRALRWDPQAHLLEYAGEQQLKDLLLQDSSKDSIVTDSFLEVIHKLHTQRAEPPPTFIGLRRRFRELFRKAETENSDSIFGYAAQLTETLLQSTQESDVVALHGDLHHENILYSKRGWLAIDPKGLTGDRHYDVANLFCNPDDQESLVLNPERIKMLTNKVVSQLSMERTRVLQFALAHAVLSATWSLLEDRHSNATLRLRVAELLHQELQHHPTK